MSEGDAPADSFDLDESTKESLRTASVLIEEMADFLAERSHTFHATSAFSEENDALSIYNTREAAVMAAQIALDHLNYIAHTSLLTGKITAFASFTLVRSAITAAAQAAWLIMGDRKQRYERTLCLTWHEVNNQREAAMGLIAPDQPRAQSTRGFQDRQRWAKATVKKQDELLGIVRADVERLGLELNVVRKKPKDQDLIKAAAESIRQQRRYSDFGAAREVLLAWRTMSAAAHGQSWAAMMTGSSTRDENGETEFVEWNPDAKQMMWGFQVAWDLICAAVDRHRVLASVGQSGPDR